MYRWLPDRNLYLGGFMASGKSTAARRLSAVLGLPWVDADKRIVEEAGAEIPEIFARYGEPHFRDLETQVIREISTRRPQIVALGGGAILRTENVQRIKDTGALVCLLPSVDVIWGRVRGKKSRPLLLARDEAEQRRKLELLYRQREELYREHADLLIEPREERQPEQTVREILTWLEENGWVEPLR